MIASERVGICESFTPFGDREPSHQDGGVLFVSILHYFQEIVCICLGYWIPAPVIEYKRLNEQLSTAIEFLHFVITKLLMGDISLQDFQRTIAIFGKEFSNIIPLTLFHKNTFKEILYGSYFGRTAIVFK